MSHFLNSSSHYSGEDGDQPSRESSSSTPPLPGHHNEVFLSFRGETRRGFTDHLYKRLYNAGISVFRDKEGLPVGERNWPELLKAIGASKISIPIISPDYASSEWCLNELVHILKCKKTFGQHVIPIFYRVKPSDVRKSLDVSKEESQACKKRRLNFHGTHVQDWKDALVEVSHMTGLESEKVADGYEGELIEIVVAEVLEALKKHALVVSDDLVGVEDHVEKIMNMVNVEGSNDVSAILIHGMGGIGKTTLAKVLYSRLAHRFDCCSFLANIRETWSQHKGKVDLQEQLILDVLGQKQSISSVDEGVTIIRDRFKYKKVLIFLDDVDCRDQMNALARNQDWFGRGSMLIITSRINNMLKEWEGIISYELNGLKDDQSFLLFCKHAFKRSHSIPNELHSIAKEIVSTTGGLPLAIEVIGCLLYNEDRSIWEEKLKELREIPDDEVQSKLKISFNALKPEEQDIFLDIACHPWIRGPREYARHMWDSYGFHSELKIRKLVSMSLIKIGGEEEEELIIHDQLRDLGREIVRQESRDNPGKRSRLWKEEEILEVLELEQGTGKIQTLTLWHPARCTSKQFGRMTKLRYLRMGRVNLEGDFENLFQNLRWLCCYFSELDFMGSNFMPKKLVVLELYEVNITKQWMGWSQMKHLKVLRLSCCYELITLPDLSALKELEVLILRGCRNLINIHPSIGKLKLLTELDLSQTRVTQLPDSIGDLCNLELLDLWECDQLECLPNLQNRLTSLKFGGDLVEILPDFSNLTNLEHLEFTHDFGRRDTTLNFRNLNRITTLRLGSKGLHAGSSNTEYYGWYSITDGFDKGFNSVHINLLLELPSTLVKLELVHCYTLRTLPDFSYLKNLTVLSIHNCPKLKKIDGLDGAESLTSVMIGSCKKLSKLGGMGISVTHLELQDLNSLASSHSLSTAKKLKNLKIFNCRYLIEIQGLDNTEGIESIIIGWCSSLERIGDLSHMKMLKTLEVRYCEKLLEIRGLGISLMNLKLEHLDSLVSLPDLSTAKKLKNLKICGYRNLIEIQGLNNLEGIESVIMDRCSILERIGDLSHLKMLTTLELCYSEKLLEIRGLGISLMNLKLEHLDSLVSLPDLSTAKKLKNLKICDCRNLIEIQGLYNAEGIESVIMDRCSSLERIGDLSHLKMLTTLELRYCEKLLEIRALGISLMNLKLEHLDSLVSLPDLSTAKKLKNLEICDCRYLIEIQGLDNAEGIGSVIMDRCSSLERIGDLSHLNMLTTLELYYCEKLLEIRALGISLMNLKLKHLDSLVSLPDLSTAKKLKNLEICDCTNLIEIQGLDNAEGIESVIMDRCSSLERIGDLSHLKMLTILELCYCEKLLEIRASGISLMNLKLEHLDSLVSLPDLSTAKKLKDLKIHKFRNLVEIQGLSNEEGIETVVIDGCSSLERIGDLFHMKMLKTLEVRYCEKLLEIIGLGISIMNLKLEHLDSLVSIPCLSTVKKLKNLRICNCRNLVDIQELDNAEGIESVVIDGCSSLERIGNLSNLKMLITLELCNCEKLSDIQGIEKITSLTSLSIYGCHPQIKFLDLSIRNVDGLRIKDERDEFPNHQNVRVIVEPLEEQEGGYLLDMSRSKNSNHIVEECCKISLGCLEAARLVIRIVAEPIEEQEGGYLPDLSQFKNSNDIVEESCEISLRCPALGQLPNHEIVRFVAEPLEEHGGGYLPDLSHFKDSNDIIVKGCEIFC